MPDHIDPPSENEEFFILNYATRLFMAITDKQMLLTTALETFADFGKTSTVGILFVDEGQQELKAAGLYKEGIFSFPTFILPPNESTPEREVIASHQITAFPLRDTSFPLPGKTGNAENAGPECICIPVARASDKVIALVTLYAEKGSLSFAEIQRVRVIASVFALSLENMRLFEMAIYDGLTGVHVRRYFEIRALEEITKMERFPGYLGIILMDIDDFKIINDRFGHVTGDEVLKECAHRISTGLRENIDIVSRYGGDEFVILLPQTSPAQTKSIANRIFSAINATPFQSLPREHAITMSIGATTVGPNEHLTTQELVHRVDRLLYAGKKGGGNKVVCLQETRKG